MSYAVQRRQRALARERRDNIGRHAGKKSSKELREASHGLEGQEELALKELDALLEARKEVPPSSSSSRMSVTSKRRHEWRRVHQKRGPKTTVRRGARRRT